MNERLQKALSKRLTAMLNFVANQKTPYKYKDLSTKTEVEIKTLDELPCEFMLMMQDADLVNRQKNSLRSELVDFLRDCDKKWEYFSGDHLHPVPNKTDFDKSTYNPTLAYYALKRNKVLWTKKSGEVRILYLKHLMSELKNVV